MCESDFKRIKNKAMQREQEQLASLSSFINLKVNENKTGKYIKEHTALKDGIYFITGKM